MPRSALPDTPDPFRVMPHAFRESLNAFLGEFGEAAPVANLAAIIRLNSDDPANRAPYGQGHLLDAQNNALDEADYRALVREHRAVAEPLETLFRRWELDALASDSQVYAPAGFPVITVPAGLDGEGRPRGMVFIGNGGGEAALLAVAYRYEQVTRAAPRPDLPAVLRAIRARIPVP